MILSKISSETIISFGSFILSIISLITTAVTYFIYNRRINKQNIKINEFTLREQKEKDDDTRKAIIEVSHIYSGRGNGELIIANVGKADARNLTMEIEENEDSGIHWGTFKIFPYRCLTPGASFKIHYGLMAGYQTDPLLKFKWDDDFSEKRFSRHSIFLG